MPFAERSGPDTRARTRPRAPRSVSRPRARREPSRVVSIVISGGAGINSVFAEHARRQRLQLGPARIAHGDEAIAVVEERPEAVVHAPGPPPEGQALSKGPGRERRAVPAALLQRSEQGDEGGRGPHGLRERGRERDHGTLVVDPADVHQEDGVGSTPSEEGHEAGQVRPRPVPHDRMHRERLPGGRGVSLRGQDVDLQPMVGEPPAQLKGVVRFPGAAVGKGRRRS